MNVRYNNLIGASIPLILMSGMLIGAINHPETNPTQKNERINVESQQVKEETSVEIRIAAGVETALDKTEAVQAQNEENAVALASEEQEYGEYSDFAIANVTNYVNVRTEPNVDSAVVGKMYDDSVAQILSVVGEGEDAYYFTDAYEDFKDVYIGGIYALDTEAALKWQLVPEPTTATLSLLALASLVTRRRRK